MDLEICPQRPVLLERGNRIPAIQDLCDRYWSLKRDGKRMHTENFEAYPFNCTNRNINEMKARREDGILEHEEANEKGPCLVTGKSSEPRVKFELNFEPQRTYR
jgi:hypothetical protein